ncbi:hypothetical protein MRX96_012878 [Rhipicephalus microplus]
MCLFKENRWSLALSKAVAVHAAIATVATTTMAVLAVVSTRVVSNAAFATAAALIATRASVAFFRAATDAAMPIDATGTTPWNHFKWFSRTYQPDAFSKYIAGRPSETAPMERLRKMNRFIAEMLNDLNK